MLTLGSALDMQRLVAVCPANQVLMMPELVSNNDEARYTGRFWG